MHKTTFRDGLKEVLRSEMRRDPRMVVLGENVATWGGASAVTSGLVDEFGPGRIVETPVSENAIVGQALGAALAGIPVVAEVYSADFLFCAGSEVINDIAKWRFQHRWAAPINLVLRMPALSSGIAAGPEHTQAIEGYLHRVNGLAVVVPGSVKEAIGALRAAIHSGDPVVFLEHRRLYDLSAELGDDDVDGYSRDLAHGTVVKPGSDLTVVAWGWMRQLVERAVERFESANAVSIEVIDPVTIRPMDFALIERSVAKTKRGLVVEEAPLTGSVSGEVITRILEAPIPEVRVTARLTMPDLPNPFHPGLEAQLVPDEQQIEKAIDKALAD